MSTSAPCSEYMETATISHQKRDASSCPYFSPIIQLLRTISKHLDVLAASSDQCEHPISPLGFSSGILITRCLGFAGDRAFCVLLLPRRHPTPSIPTAMHANGTPTPSPIATFVKIWGSPLLLLLPSVGTTVTVVVGAAVADRLEEGSKSKLSSVGLRVNVSCVLQQEVELPQHQSPSPQEVSW